MVVVWEKCEVQFILFEAIGIVNILLAFGRNIRSNGLNLDAFEIFAVEMILFAEVGEVVMIGDHERVDITEADVESAVVDDLWSEMLQMVLDLVVVEEVCRLIEAVEPFRVDLEVLLALLQLLYLPCLHNADVFLVLCLPSQLTSDLVHEVLPELLSSDLIIAHALNHQREVHMELLKVAFTLRKLLVIVKEKVSDLMCGQPDAVELVNIVEDRKVFAYSCDFTCTCFCLNSKHFFCLTGVFGSVGAGIAKTRQT